MKSYMKLLLLAAICGVMNIYGGILDHTSINLSGIIYAMGFGGISFLPAGISDVMYWYVPLLLFHIFYGTFLYRHFCSASVYYFSRTGNRMRWYIGETFRLFCLCILYLVVMSFSGIAVVSCFLKLEYGTESFYLLFYYLLLFSLFLFVSTLAINVLSVLWNNTIAFCVVEGIYTLGIAVYLCMGQWMDSRYLREHMAWLRWNPFAHLVFCVHSSKISGVNQIINEYKFVFDLEESVFVYFIAAVIVIVLGGIIIKKHDFIMLNKETEG